MNRDNITNNPSLVLSGVNLVGLMAITAYTVRNLNEVNVYLDEIREELKSLKSSQSENTKRSFKAISTLNDKIEGVSTKARPFKQPETQPKRQQKIIEFDEEEDDDVSSAIHELMR